jgi:NADH-quinone oxidoreductase subunit J
MIWAEIIFGLLALIVIGSAVGMLVNRNAVFSALFLVLNFMAVAVMYFVLGAPFIAMAQITVYAGAIMVLFLFVIMLLGAESLPIRESLSNQRWLGIIIGLVFLVEIGLMVVVRGGGVATLTTLSYEFAGPEAIGMALLTQYQLPFEITSVILLVAVIGAVVLTKMDKVIRK